jgi:hypothetical protein
MDLYSTYTMYQEIESGKIRVPDDVLFRVMQWILDSCQNVKGEWIGGNPFEDLALLESIMKDNMVHARDNLDEPEKSDEMAVNFRLYCVFSKIRRDLEKRFERKKDSPWYA